jgi:hypothetical protein
LINWHLGNVINIRDYRYSRYVLEGAEVVVSYYAADGEDARRDWRPCRRFALLHGETPLQPVEHESGDLLGLLLLASAGPSPQLSG